MSTQSKSKAPYVIGVIIAIVVISALVPYKAWDFTVKDYRITDAMERNESIMGKVWFSP